MNDFKKKIFQLITASTTAQLFEKQLHCTDKEVRKFINEELRKRGLDPYSRNK